MSAYSMPVLLCTGRFYSSYFSECVFVLHLRLAVVPSPRLLQCARQTRQSALDMERCAEVKVTRKITQTRYKRARLLCTTALCTVKG